MLLHVPLYLRDVVMHAPLWAQKGPHHAGLQYQTTGTGCCHESISTLATACLQPSLTVILTYLWDTNFFISHSSNQLADVEKDRNEINCLHFNVYQPQAAFDIWIILSDSVFVFSHRTFAVTCGAYFIFFLANGHFVKL